MTLDDEDIQKLLNTFMPIFATKQDLEELKNEFVTNERFDQALGTLDQIAGDVKAIREEQAAHQAKHDRIDEDLEAIKTIPTIAHELSR